MAETTGKIQKLVVNPAYAVACVWIGTPANSELLSVLRETSEPASQGSYENSMVEALAAAAAGGLTVTASHADNQSRITNLQILPA